MVGWVVAGVCGCGAAEEGGGIGVGAGGVAEQVGGLVDTDDFNAFGRREIVSVRVLRKQDGLLHELSPDGCGGVCAFDFDVSVIVIANPDNADEVAGVASEPCIVTGAGFACGWCGESTLTNHC